MDAPQTAETAPVLRLHLLGGFRAIREGGPAAAEKWPRPSAQALVKLLAVTPGHRLHREQAMAACWPDADQQSATGSLRVALHAARRALEPELAPRAASSYLISEGALLRLDPATVWIDADQVETSARHALDDGSVAHLTSALREFRGELLPEDRYAQWARARRDQLAALREEVLLALAAAHMAQGAPAEAVTAAEQVLAASPAEERAHCVLIDAFVRQGLRRRAVHQYHLCREALDAELGVRPGPGTERLHRAALAAPPALSPTIRPTLPAPLRSARTTPLHGRAAELARLLADEGPPVRLLTGEAGVGKTRLAGEAARRAVASGTVVLWGAGHDAEGHTPYGVFAEALDGWLAGRDVAERARVGAEYPELAAFLPSLGQVPAFGRRSPEEERDRLFRATAGLLGELASYRPVLLVLDDLHAADTGSYQLLTHLARRTGLRFLVTYREEELPPADPRRADLTTLLRQRLAVVEPVPRLGRAACLAVARDVVGVGAAGVSGAGVSGAGVSGAGVSGAGVAAAEVSEESAGFADEERLGRVWELSLGNPLFALELARGLVAAGRDGAAGRAGGVGELSAGDGVAGDGLAGGGAAGYGTAGYGPGDATPSRTAAEAVTPKRGTSPVEPSEHARPAAPGELTPGAAAEPGAGPELVAPDGIRQLVAERLVRLDHGARRMVEVLSAAGAVAVTDEVLDVAAQGLHPPVTGAEAAEALERAIAAALIEERPVVVSGRQQPGLAFRHPLVRLTCYEGLSAVRRRQLHGAFAQAVQRRRPEAVDTLATHFARADDPRAADYLRRAAERAAALYANDTADRYYRDLVVRLDVDAARARLAHAHVLRRMGHFEQAADVLRLALAEFERRGAHDDAVLTAALLAETLVKTSATASARRILRAHPVGEDTAPEPAAHHHLALSVIRCVQGRYAEGAAAARDALTAASAVPGAAGQGLTARAFALQAANLGLDGRFEGARAAGDQALAPAEAYGDPTLLGSVLSTLRENARRAGRLHEAVEIGTRALGLAERSGDPTAAAFERANLAELRLLLEEPGPARALAEQAVAGAEAYDAWCLPYALMTLALVHVRLGTPDEAGALLDRAGSVADARGDRQARHEVRAARAELALRARRPDEALDVLAGHTADDPVLASWAELLADRPESAAAFARTEVARAERTGERLAEVEARIALGVALIRLGRERAGETGPAGESRAAGESGPAGEGELSRAASLAAALPYPAGTRRVAWARELLGT
ncbi:AAA family ATPase [Streptomyces sp. NPDC050418]|uniref:AAA family ATPase n=1 Tax=Streptomyces sp. NPDC050418 TaxID=3365612 RepID=UPI00379E7D69